MASIALRLRGHQAIRLNYIRANASTTSLLDHRGHRGPDISPPATSPPGHEPAGQEPAGHEPATGGSQARQRWVKSPPNHELVLACTGKI